MSLGVALPLTFSSTDGFTMIKTIKRLIRQNLKMLILTIPGERVMNPDYGVGLKTFLFSGFNASTYSEIDDKIRQQVRSYMPMITIDDIVFTTDQQELAILGISLHYSIPNLAFIDVLELSTGTTAI
jgi:phage baseplate assembly protein W